MRLFPYFYLKNIGSNALCISVSLFNYLVLLEAGFNLVLLVYHRVACTSRVRTLNVSFLYLSSPCFSRLSLSERQDKACTVAVPSLFGARYEEKTSSRAICVQHPLAANRPYISLVMKIFFSETGCFAWGCRGNFSKPAVGRFVCRMWKILKTCGT